MRRARSGVAGARTYIDSASPTASTARAGKSSSATLEARVGRSGAVASEGVAFAPTNVTTPSTGDNTERNGRVIYFTSEIGPSGQQRGSSNYSEAAHAGKLGLMRAIARGLLSDVRDQRRSSHPGPRTRMTDGGDGLGQELGGRRASPAERDRRSDAFKNVAPIDQYRWLRTHGSLANGRILVNNARTRHHARVASRNGIARHHASEMWRVL